MHLNHPLILSIALGLLAAKPSPPAAMAGEKPPLDRVASFEEAGALAIARGRWAAAAASLRQCAAGYKELGDARGEALCLLGLGLAENRRQDRQAALSSLLDGLAVSAQSPLAADLALPQHLLLAEVYLALPARSDEALAHLDHALSLSRSLGDRSAEAVALDRLAAVDGRRGAWSDAAAHLETALAIARQAGADEVLSLCLFDLAAVSYRRGRFPEAAALFEEASRLANRRNLPLDEAVALRHLGAAQLAEHQDRQALASLRRAETLLQAGGDPGTLWAARGDIAQALAALGELEQAASLYQAAIEHYRGTAEEWQIPPLLSGAAEVFARQGRPGEQRASLEAALLLWRQLGNHVGEARLLDKLGKLELGGGSYEEALKRFEEALAASRSVADPTGEAAALFNSAHLYFDLGRYEEALSRYTEVLRLARELGNQLIEASALRDRARLLLIAGRLDEADAGIEEALMLARRIGNPVQEIDGLRLKGELLSRRGAALEAFAPFAAALSLSKQLPDPEEKLKVLVSIGLLQLSGGDPAGAARTFEAVASARRARGITLQEATLLNLLATCYQDLGATGKSIALFRQAFEAEDSQLARIATDDLLLGMTRFHGDVAQSLIPLLADAGRSEEAFGIVERSRARAFLLQIGNRRIAPHGSVDRAVLAEEEQRRDALRALGLQLRDELRKPFGQRDPALLETLSQELEDGRRRYETLLIRLKQTNPQYASLRRPETLALPAVQRLLGKETTLLEYFVLPDRTLVWVIDRQSSHLVRLPVGARELGERTAFWRQSLAARAPDAGQALALGRDLLVPLEPHLRGRKLLIVPHGALHSLPFAALRDAAGAALVERGSLTYLPSASAIPLLARRRTPPGNRLLVLGDPDGSLPFAAAEARAVASLYGATPLLGSEASLTALRQRARGLDLLHIAAHAVFDPARPLFSRIQLAGGPGGDGNLEMHDAYGLDLAGTSLVVLSGCATGLGDLAAGDNFIGWSRAFLYAGAAAVVTTLWPVEDDAAAALMTRFHRRLAAGVPAAQALRQAQVEIARQERWRSPYFWAGFTLAGDGGELSSER